MKIEWPKEKLKHYSAGKLTKSELLAVLLKNASNGTDIVELAQKIIRKYPRFELAKVSPKELKENFKISESKACEIIACFQLGKRMMMGKRKKK